MRYTGGQEGGNMVDEAKLHAFVEKAVGDLGSALTAALVVIGDQLGLYRAMADSKPVTSAELAERTGTSERCVREWLAGQAAAGYLTYDAASGRYTLPPEQAIALADETSPACLLGGFQGMTAAMRAQPKVTEAFRHGKGVGWHEHDADLFLGTERFFRPGYDAHLVREWIPALDGVDEKLERGARVADVGCGLGASTIIMAKAFPRSTFIGFDYHQPSVETARERAAQAGVGDRVRFEVASAKDYPGTLRSRRLLRLPARHGRPARRRHARPHVARRRRHVAARRAVRRRSRRGQPASARARVLLGVDARLYPASLAQEVGTALGAQAGEQRLRDVVTNAGFTRFRRATETPFNLVFEARP